MSKAILSVLLGVLASACGDDGNLDGKSFESVATTEMGLGPNGAIIGHSTIRFENGEYNWLISDKHCHGSYSYSDGAVTAQTKIPCLSNGTISGRYDEETGMLTWSGEQYRPR